MSVYIPSTTQGKTWSVSVTKDRTGNVCGHAVEGTATADSFRYILFQARSVSASIDTKRATKAAKARALKAVIEKLEAEGLAKLEAAA